MDALNPMNFSVEHDSDHFTREKRVLLVIITAPSRASQLPPRDAQGRFLPWNSIPAVQQQLFTPGPSQSPTSQLTQPESDLPLTSALTSLSSSPHESDIPFPLSPARGGGYEASSESDGETQPAPSTPVRTRTRRSSQPSAPAPIRIYSDRRRHSPEPTRESSPAASPTLVFVTPAPPPAPVPAPATSRPMTGSSTSSVRDAWSQVNALGRFSGGNKPISEAEYHFNFVSYTQGLSDEEIAKLWAGNLKYDSLAHLWLEDLQATDPDKAKKWSLLEKEIEKRWPTPRRDREARKIGLRRAWEDHTFNIEAMVAGLTDETSTVRPHQVWAEDHKALALSVNSTDEDRVAKTVDYDLPQWLVNLLLRRERYGSDFEGLIKDLGEITSRTLLDPRVFDRFPPSRAHPSHVPGRDGKDHETILAAP
ncbi:hypothetical protein FRC08_015534 [Ceratobasidium sp. 394]|nr:hypothetical protein FRC08_015534 [Ceratobasidium sp. 394]